MWKNVSLNMFICELSPKGVRLILQNNCWKQKSPSSICTSIFSYFQCFIIHKESLMLNSISLSVCLWKNPSSDYHTCLTCHIRCWWLNDVSVMCSSTQRNSVNRKLFIVESRLKNKWYPLSSLLRLALQTANWNPPWLLLSSEVAASWSPWHSWWYFSSTSW